MFSKVNGKVDLYPKQTIAKESPTKTRSTLACSAMDPDIESHAVSSVAIAKSRASNYQSKISFIETTAESIDLESSSFDSVVIGYSLCTIPDPMQALSEAYRLLKPNGSLFFMEHGLAPEPNIQKWQNRIAPFWKKIGGGCNLNRNIEALILSGGFKFKDLKKKYIKGPKIASFLYYGEAPKV